MSLLSRRTAKPSPAAEKPVATEPPSLQDLLADPAIYRITCYAPDRIETNVNLGSPLTFPDTQQLKDAIILACNVHHVSRDTLTPDKSGIQRFSLLDNWTLIVNHAVNGQPTYLFRRPPDPKRIESRMLEQTVVSQQALDFLQACVVSQLNVVVSANQRQVASDLLRVLAQYIPDNETIVVIADPVKFAIPHQQTHQIWEYSESAGVNRTDLVRRALELDPQRVIVAELAGMETFDILLTMIRGYQGSMAALYARHARHALEQLELNCVLAGQMDSRVAYRQLIDEAVHLIVQINRLNDGTDHVTQITEVQGMSGDINLLVDLFAYKIDGMVNERYIGQLTPTGIRPQFSQHFEAHGIHLPMSMFLPNAPSPRR